MMRFGLAMDNHCLYDIIPGRRLSFFGHLSRADPSQDHSRALQLCILGPPRDWRHRVGRPRRSWLRTVEDDLHPLYFGLATARWCTLDRPAWRLLAETATSTWHAPERESLQRLPACPLWTCKTGMIKGVCVCIHVCEIRMQFSWVKTLTGF